MYTILCGNRVKPSYFLMVFFLQCYVTPHAKKFLRKYYLVGATPVLLDRGMTQLLNFLFCCEHQPAFVGPFLSKSFSSYISWLFFGPKRGMLRKRCWFFCPLLIFLIYGYTFSFSLFFLISCSRKNRKISKNKLIRWCRPFGLVLLM